MIINCFWQEYLTFKLQRRLICNSFISEIFDTKTHSYISLLFLKRI